MTSNAELTPRIAVGHLAVWLGTWNCVHRVLGKNPGENVTEEFIECVALFAKLGRCESALGAFDTPETRAIVNRVCPEWDKWLEVSDRGRTLVENGTITMEEAIANYPECE